MTARGTVARMVRAICKTNKVEKSTVAKHIIQSVPFTTNLIKQLWVTNLIG